MVDNIPEDKEASPDVGRPKRAPPTIDLEATEVSSETQHAGADVPPEPSSQESPQASSKASAKTMVPAAILSAVCGAGAAALVIGGVWLSGWPAAAPT